MERRKYRGTFVRTCFSVLTVIAFTWIFIFIHVNQKDLKEDEGKFMPTWKTRDLRASIRDQHMEFIPENTLDVRKDYYDELSKDDVLEVIGDKVRMNMLAEDARDAILKEMLHDGPRDSLAYIKLKDSLTDRKKHEPEHNLTFWTLNLDPVEVFEIKHLLQKFGVRIIERNFSPLCSKMNTCASSLFPGLQASSLLENSHRNVVNLLMRHNYTWLPEINNADAILCLSPCSTCQLFFQQGKPLIVLPTHRYEVGRSARWMTWNLNLKQINYQETNTLAVRDEYDKQYMNHFLGITPTLIGRHCGYVDLTYTPEFPHIFLYPGAPENFLSMFKKDLFSTLEKEKENILVKVGNTNHIKDPTRLKEYKAIIYIPTRVSSIKFTELYRMNIPLYIPSYKLLALWESEYRLILDRVFPNSTRKFDTGVSLISGRSSAFTDPNLYSVESLTRWLQYLEYYNMPGVQYFASVRDLADKLRAASTQSLKAYSSRMKAYNAVNMRYIESKWKEVIRRVRKNKQEHVAKLYQRKMR